MQTPAAPGSLATDRIDDVLVRLDHAKHLRLIAATLHAGANRGRHGLAQRAGDEREQRIAGRRAQALVKVHVVLHEDIDVAPGALHPAHGAGQHLDVVGAAFLGRQLRRAHLDGRAQIQGLFGRRLLRRQRVLQQMDQRRTAQSADAGGSPVRDLEDPRAAQRTIRFTHDPATDLQVGAQAHFGRQPLAGCETVRADVVHQVVRHPIGQVAVLLCGRERRRFCHGSLNAIRLSPATRS